MRVYKVVRGLCTQVVEVCIQGTDVDGLSEDGMSALAAHGFPGCERLDVHLATQTPGIALMPAALADDDWPALRSLRVALWHGGLSLGGFGSLSRLTDVTLDGRQAWLIDVYFERSRRTLRKLVMHLTSGLLHDGREYNGMTLADVGEFTALEVLDVRAPWTVRVPYRMGVRRLKVLAATPDLMPWFASELEHVDKLVVCGNGLSTCVDLAALPSAYCVLLRTEAESVSTLTCDSFDAFVQWVRGRTLVLMGRGDVYLYSRHDRVSAHITYGLVPNTRGRVTIPQAMHSPDFLTLLTASQMRDVAAGTRLHPPTAPGWFYVTA